MSGQPSQSHRVDNQRNRITVGSVVLNTEGLALLGDPIRPRINDGLHFSQGGKNPRETAVRGSRRECGEEFGIQSTDLFTIAAIQSQPFYPVPDPQQNDRYDALRLGFHVFLLRDGATINLNSHMNGEPPEFKSYLWTDIENVLGLCPDYKADAYEKFVKATLPVADALKRLHQAGRVLSPQQLVRAVRQDSFVAAAFEVGLLARRLQRFPGKPYRRLLTQEAA